MLKAPLVAPSSLALADALELVAALCWNAAEASDTLKDERFSDEYFLDRFRAHFAQMANDDDMLAAFAAIRCAEGFERHVLPLYAWENEE